ncbi:MAG: hypothetical protein ACHRXM_29015 [Isosphaerales bacterium]
MFSSVRRTFWVSCISARSRHLLDSARDLQLRLGVSVFVCALFTSALVVAQVPGTGTVPVGSSTRTAVQEKVATTPDKKEGGRQDVKGKAPIATLPARGNQADAVAARALAADRRRQNMIKQYTTMGRPFVRAELIFVRHICRMSQEKLRQISREAGDVLSDVVTKMVDARLQPTMSVRNRRSVALNPYNGKVLQDGLTAVMKKHLSAEQWSRYQAELDKRYANRKQVAVRYFVDALDRDLYLSDVQRATLTDSLSAHWDDGWNVYLEYLLQGNHFYPFNIDHLVLPILSEAQKTAWQGSQKVNLDSVFGGILGPFAQDNDALEEELGEVKKADPRNAETERRRMEMEGRLMIEARVGEIIEREVEARQRVEVREAEMKKIESKKAETKKGVANQGAAKE